MTSDRLFDYCAIISLVSLSIMALSLGFAFVWHVFTGTGCP